VGLARAGRPSQPGESRVLAAGDPARVLQRLRVARREKVCEYRAVRQAQPQGDLAHAPSA
jgi:hypothetical protein